MEPDRDTMDDEAPVNPSSNPTFQSILAARLSRRGFLAGAGIGLAAAAAGTLAPRRPAEAQGATAFAPVKSSNEDKLLLPPGYKHSVVVRWAIHSFRAPPSWIRPPRPRRARNASSDTTTTSSGSCRFLQVVMERRAGSWA